MENNQADKVVSEIKKDFVAVGIHSVHGWYTWAVVGAGIGAIIAVSYVANLSGQFDAGRAAEGSTLVNDSQLWFAQTEGSGETNPVLIVYSQSQEPVSFSYALAGSNDFQPLDGDFNWGQISAGAPYQFTFIPSIFADHRARNDDPESNEIIAAVPAGTYTIRATQEQTESESSEPTAQAINIGLPIQNPFPAPLPAAPGAAKHPFVLFSNFIFRFGGFPGGMGVAGAPAQQAPYAKAASRLYSCQNIQLEDDGPVDSYFLNMIKDSAYMKLMESGLGAYVDYKNEDDHTQNVRVKYSFQIRADLKKSGGKIYPNQGQGVKMEVTYHPNSPSEAKELWVYDYQRRNVFQDLIKTSDFLKIDRNNYFPFFLSGDRFFNDDYHGVSDVNLSADLSSTNKILWFDAPGTSLRGLGLKKEDLPTKYEYDFVHYIRGSSGDGSRDGTWDCKYSWHDDCVTTIEGALQAIGASYTKVDPPQLTRTPVPWTRFTFKSPSCLCNSHLIIDVDKDGEPTFPPQKSDCNKNNGGKVGSLAQTDEIDDLLKNHYGPPSQGGTGSSGGTSSGSSNPGGTNAK